MSDNNDDQMIPTPSEFGHFLLEKELGHGGMGGVYLARDKMLDRQVGIKVMLKSLGDDPAFVERFQREAQAAARLNHPNIAQIYSFGKENGMPYIAMELVSGGSLDKDMEKSPGTLDPVRIMRVGQQLADALALAAEQGLVHGDVKPENVLYDNEGNAKLVDFGLAAMQGDANEIWGTPYYISPEKVRRQKIDFRADIYSLGGTLYHAITGVAPFEGENATEVVKARFQGPPRKPSEVRPDVPPEIDTIIMRMLEVEPSMRYPTYQSLLGDFKRFLSKAGPSKMTSKIASSKVKIKGTKIKVKLTADENEPMAPVGDVDDLVSIASLEEERNKANAKRISVGVIVASVVVGVIMLVLLVAGGLYWYVHSQKERERREAYEQLIATQERAKNAIRNTMKAVEDYGVKFHELMVKNDKEIDSAVRQVKAVVPAEMKAAAAAFIVPPPTADIADAIAFTNQLFTAALAQAQADKNAAAADAKAKAEAEKAKSADTNAVAKADAKAKPAGTNAVAKADAKAKPAEAKPAEAKPEAAEDPMVEKLPAAVKQFVELWNDVYACRAADIRVQGSVKLLLMKGEKMAELTKDDEETARALGKLSTQLVEGLEQIKSMKCVELAQRKVSVIRNKSKSLVEQAQKQIKRMLDKAEKEAKDKAEKEAKAAAAEKLANERKLKIELEVKRAKDSFPQIVTSRLKYLEWDRANAEMQKLLDESSTAEGRDEVRTQSYKIKFMQELQQHFVEALRKYIKEAKMDNATAGDDEPDKLFRFKNGSAVMAVDDKAITIAKLKSTRGQMKVENGVAVEWSRFYGREEYVGQMSQMINTLVRKGRDTVHLSMLKWEQLMLGAALTLQNLYADASGADDFSKLLVKEVADQLGDDDEAMRWPKKWFADILDGSADKDKDEAKPADKDDKKAAKKDAAKEDKEEDDAESEDDEDEKKDAKKGAKPAAKK